VRSLSTGSRTEVSEGFSSLGTSQKDGVLACERSGFVQDEDIPVGALRAS